jgi:hypothetical protein
MVIEACLEKMSNEKIISHFGPGPVSHILRLAIATTFLKTDRVADAALIQYLGVA